MIEAILAPVLIGVYLLPGIIGSRRHHPQEPLIWLLNICLGWTGIGWLAALAWATSGSWGKAEHPRRP